MTRPRPSSGVEPGSPGAVRVGILVWLIVMILPIFTSVAQASPIYIDSAVPPAVVLVAGLGSGSALATIPEQRPLGLAVLVGTVLGVISLVVVVLAIYSTGGWD